MEIHPESQPETKIDYSSLSDEALLLEFKINLIGAIKRYIKALEDMSRPLSETQIFATRVQRFDIGTQTVERINKSENQYLVKTQEILKVIRDKLSRETNIYYNFDRLMNIISEIAMALSANEPNCPPLYRRQMANELRRICARLYHDPLLFDTVILREPPILTRKVDDIRYRIERICMEQIESSIAA